ncbi:hypothetical protein P8936_15800 [Edaphobacter paludis]|uniref:Uncharacterized protein n=1 Tax=Edaphobacter paludis TaxID=3035702 RepID=A0AAU7D6Y5_9BACT
MKFCSHSRSFGNFSEGHHDSTVEDLPQEDQESTLFRTIGWISAGLGAVALGLFVGRELRLRYKFNHRTPYDFYAHAGDEENVDFGLGI